MAAAAGDACQLCREYQLKMECCRGGLLPDSAGPRAPLPDAVEEDRISALPDDLLLGILARLGCARAAAHTGQLARRWRGLWARVPELTFHRIAPDSLDAALAQVAAAPAPAPAVAPAPSLLDIDFCEHYELEPARLSSSLRAAAAVAPAKLVVQVTWGSLRSPVELPCFDRAASINVNAWPVQFALPPAGGFPALESLHLENCGIDLGDLLPCCPRLRSLWIPFWNSSSVVVRSQSIQEFGAGPNFQIQQLEIAAPALKMLNMDAGRGIGTEFSLSSLISAVEDFTWKCETTAVYSGDGTKSFQQEIFRFQVTNFSVLELDLAARGHVYGAIVMHLLGLCTSVQRLKICLDEFLMSDACFGDCICDQPNNWRSQSISLNDLKEIKIQGFRGKGHEVDLLKVLLRCATVLQSVSLAFSRKISLSDSECGELDDTLKAYPSVKFNIYHWSGKWVLYE